MEFLCSHFPFYDRVRCLPFSLSITTFSSSSVHIGLVRAIHDKATKLARHMQTPVKLMTKQTSQQVLKGYVNYAFSLIIFRSLPSNENEEPTRSIVSTQILYTKGNKCVLTVILN